MTHTTHCRHPYARPRNPIRRPVAALALTLIAGSLSTHPVAAQTFGDDEQISVQLVHQGSPGHKHRRRAPHIMLRPPSDQRPRLGFAGHMHSGWGMMVDQVIPGSTAARLGLEPGDVVMTINGKQVTCAIRYRELLWEATNQFGGRVTLKVDNIRARQGFPVPRFAFITGWLNHGNYYASGSHSLHYD